MMYGRVLYGTIPRYNPGHTTNNIALSLLAAISCRTREGRMIWEIEQLSVKQLLKTHHHSQNSFIALVG